MMNSSHLMNKLEIEGMQSLIDLLAQVPALNREDIQAEPRQTPDGAVDFLLKVQYNGKPHVIVAEVKTTAPPKEVRSSILGLQKVVRDYGKEAVPLLLAPYLSPEARAICQDHEVAYLDLEGNCRLSFDTIFIDRRVPTKPVLQRREFKSLFSPKSAQVLGMMMRNPSRSWKVHDLSAESSVSVGHVSNVRTALLDKEWAKIDDDGFFLAQPDAILDAWREMYTGLSGQDFRFYTTLHGSALDEKIRTMFGQIVFTKGAAVLASFSAAKWIAPYVRTGNEYFYANGEGLAFLKEHLKLVPATKGENVVVTLLEGENFYPHIENPAPDIFCTDVVQTYLDLWASGERGREAAEHLRNEKLAWKR
ncbi:type IV toxin-antitoxin system AbiEi family antitoxin [Collimonas sp.]|jgi:hypothetical protein|uniref:type IV toxin-antitoxin system AbiEi family antitoxin n=1 Tax=Collimonas sp. TaxID=1963772 RepID=UPI002D80C339|nr:hypothetical protein [Collimonas sp.]